MMKQGLISNSTKNRVTAQTLSFSREKYLPLHFSCISSTVIKVQSLQEISKVTPIFINTLLPILSKMYKFSRCYMTCYDAMATIVMECTQSQDPLSSTAHIGPCNSSQHFLFVSRLFFPIKMLFMLCCPPSKKHKLLMPFLHYPSTRDYRSVLPHRGPNFNNTVNSDEIHTTKSLGSSIS